MKLLQFDTIEQYREAQIQANLEKLKRVWSSKKELSMIARFLLKECKDLSFGLCHGARNGFEVEYLRSLLDCEVLGTDISPSASQFENMVQWDFHIENPEWIGKADFVFTNSLDHAHDPKTALTTWGHSLKPYRYCFIETHRHDSPPTRLTFEKDISAFPNKGADCFLFDTDSLKEWVEKEIVELSVIKELRFSKKNPFNKRRMDLVLLVLQKREEDS